MSSRPPFASSSFFHIHFELTLLASPLSTLSSHNLLASLLSTSSSHNHLHPLSSSSSHNHLPPLSTSSSHNHLHPLSSSSSHNHLPPLSSSSSHNHLPPLSSSFLLFPLPRSFYFPSPLSLPLTNTIPTNHFCAKASNLLTTNTLA